MAGLEVPSLVTTGVASQKLKMSESHIRKQCKEGKIPHTKTPGGHYRIPESWLQAQIKKRRKEIESISQVENRPRQNESSES